MMELILLATMSVLPRPAEARPFRPCVWPNRCAPQARVRVAQYKPCVWPNRCGRADLAA